MSTPNTINYIEFPAKSRAELEAARDFYSSAFGWTYQMWGDDYADTSGSGIATGITGIDGTAAPLAVVFVADLEATYARLQELGATITREIFEFPGGRRFHFIDPAGNELAAWTEA